MTRHELKEQLEHDQFTETVSSALEYATSHKQRLMQWAIVAGIVVVLVIAAVWFNSYRRGQRQRDLQAAFAILDAQVGPPSEYAKTFATQEEKTRASIKALSDVVAKDGGTAEGDLAQYYLGTLKAQQGDLKGAEADLSKVASSRSESAALAKIALAQVYLATNRTAKAQEVLRSLVNKPTELVSKAQAQILLAQAEATVNPKEAKQILQSLQGPKTDPAVSRAANQVLAELAK